MILDQLYHWSPTDRRASIQQHGLIPGSPALVSSTEQGHVCLGFDPASAWAISGAMPYLDVPSWDLWQVRLDDEDSVSIRPEFGPRLQEVMVRNTIPAERLWLVGERRR